MYLLFRLKNISPSDYYWKKPGEKIILRAFMEREAEERRKDIEHG